MTKRILWCNEMSGLSSGFATYGREVMKGLFASGKYELFEFATYGDIIDKKFTFPWGYYGNNPDPRNEEDRKMYAEDVTNQFGNYRFNHTVLDCKPDVVIDIRDHWMLQHEAHSALRRFYHWAIMPTVDADPQPEQWLSDYMSADSVCTYSDYGFNTLKQEGNSRIPLFKTIPYGVDLNVFKPVRNRAAFRKELGFSNDVFIIGTVMRNQKRKLYPDLLDAFKEYLSYCNEHGYKELAEKSFLYLHTSYPDSGWDIPKMLNRTGLGSKVLFTYRCTTCGHIFPTYFQDARTVCRKCGKKTAGLPTVQAGVTTEALAQIYNLFDVYVQYANSEGFGMPQVEAAACGVPVFATDYSAMEDVVRKVKGFPIDVERFVYESETSCRRALPSNKDFVQKLVKFATNPVALKEKRAADARRGVEQHYTWDKTIKLWEELLDRVPERNPNRWKEPPRIFNYPKDRARGLDNEQFVAWCYHHVLGQPELIGDYRYMKTTKDLNYEHVLVGKITEQRWLKYDQDLCFEYFCNVRDDMNYWEAKRCGMINEPTPKFLELARNPYE